MTDNTKGGVTQYSYDLVGNRICMTNPDGSTARYSYNPRNKLIQQQDGTGLSRFDYDNMGRELTATLPDNSITRRQYNKENHLESLITSNKTVEDDRVITSHYNEANQLLQSGDTYYSYDDNGNQISRKTEEGTSLYQYTADNFLAAFTSAKGRLLAKQIYPDQPRSQTTPESLFYHHDALGSIIGLSDINNKLVTPLPLRRLWQTACR